MTDVKVKLENIQSKLPYKLQFFCKYFTIYILVVKLSSKKVCSKYAKSPCNI